MLTLGLKAYSSVLLLARSFSAALTFWMSLVIRCDDVRRRHLEARLTAVPCALDQPSRLGRLPRVCGLAGHSRRPISPLTTLGRRLPPASSKKRFPPLNNATLQPLPLL